MTAGLVSAFVLGYLLTYDSTMRQLPWEMRKLTQAPFPFNLLSRDDRRAKARVPRSAQPGTNVTGMRFKWCRTRYIPLNIFIDWRLRRILHDATLRVLVEINSSVFGALALVGLTFS